MYEVLQVAKNSWSMNLDGGTEGSEILNVEGIFASIADACNHAAQVIERIANWCVDYDIEVRDATTGKVVEPIWEYAESL